MKVSSVVGGVNVFSVSVVMVCLFRCLFFSVMCGLVSVFCSCMGVCSVSGEKFLGLVIRCRFRVLLVRLMWLFRLMWLLWLFRMVVCGCSVLVWKLLFSCV